MNRLSLSLFLFGASAACYRATAELPDGGPGSGSSSSGGSSGSGQCVVPTPGSCTGDSDCVVAFCSDASCYCGGGSAIARSQLDPSACLVEAGSNIPPGCEPPPGGCLCPLLPTCAAQCVQGACACRYTCPNEMTSCNGLCSNTDDDPDNCGSCGHVCPQGQLCAGGACSGGGSSGSSSSGGSSSGSNGTSSSGGADAGPGCSSDGQCPAGDYCDYSVQACGAGSRTVVQPGSCAVNVPPDSSCATNQDCGPSEACQLFPCDPVGDGGCPAESGRCEPIECPVGDAACDPDCAYQEVPHGCGACVCQSCALPATPDGGCTEDSQCGGGSYCDFTTEPCGQPIGNAVVVPGTCLDATPTGQSCLTDGDCGSGDYCDFPPCASMSDCAGVCTPVTCNQPPQACAAGCSSQAIPHGCSACICVACCLQCE